MRAIGASRRRTPRPLQPPLTLASWEARGDLDFVPAHDTVTCASVAAAGDGWVVAWLGDARAHAPSPVFQQLYLRHFAR